MAAVFAALQVCPPCSATCDWSKSREAARSSSVSHQHQTWLFFGLSPQFFWSHLTTLVLAWGDWWALPVPLPVPLRDKVLPANSPFSLRNTSGRPDTVQVNIRLSQSISSSLLGWLYSPCSPDPQPPQGNSPQSKKTQQYVLSSFLFCFKPQ